jgi:pimeloyl-ACP methyl ester carboxylesterase
MDARRDCLEVKVGTADDRNLDVLVAGARDAVPLVFHTPSPTGAVPFAPFISEVLSRGLSFVSYSRPGYGNSTPQPGRRVADAVDDVTTILASLGYDRFVAAGWAGGGHYSLACAALMPESCAAAAVIGNEAPLLEVGADWLFAISEDRLIDIRGAQGDLADYDRSLQWMREIRPLTAEEWLCVDGNFGTPSDPNVREQWCEWRAEMARRGFLRSVAGWRDDEVAAVRPWGFALSSITRPVAVWHGLDDRVVDVQHARWLVERLPTAEPHLIAGASHVAVGIDLWPCIVEDLAAKVMAV